MNVGEALALLMETDAPVSLVVERFTFAPGQGVNLTYNSKMRAAVLALPLKDQCGGLQDFRQALMDFARQAKKFMDSRGLMPVGKPFMCDDQFVWEIKNDPNNTGTFKPKPKTEPESYFTPEMRRHARKWRDQNYSNQQNKGFVQRFLDQFS